MSERRIAVVSAGVGAPSTSRVLADALADGVVRELRDRGDDARVVTVELRDHAHGLVDALIACEPAEELQSILGEVAAADALIAVSPTMSAGVNGLFKMFFDVMVPGALDGKPVILGATGGSGRHALMLDYAMRPLFSYLRAQAVGTGVFAGPGDFADESRADLEARIARAARELTDAVMVAGAPTGELVGR